MSGENFIAVAAICVPVIMAFIAFMYRTMSGHQKQITDLKIELAADYLTKVEVRELLAESKRDLRDTLETLITEIRALRKPTSE
jgi:hypothetical protein